LIFGTSLEILIAFGKAVVYAYRMQSIGSEIFAGSARPTHMLCFKLEEACRFQITTNKMQRFLIYLFLQTLYMFQAIPPPIIRSTQLYVQLQVLSTNTAASCYHGGDRTEFHLPA
jgi:hypothetical protein